MKVRKIRAGYWEVHDGSRFYSVQELDRPPWVFILNGSLRAISPSGQLGKRILRAVEPDR